ncbi:MAG: hypothetical protein OJF49_001868 [Ktedonobacterales bacterium]|nr:MAG: hypothetical protein OJF49_001868 [Ktedonobacterales bacterium]
MMLWNICDEPETAAEWLHGRGSHVRFSFDSGLAHTADTCFFMGRRRAERGNEHDAAEKRHSKA